MAKRGTPEFNSVDPVHPFRSGVLWLKVASRLDFFQLTPVVEEAMQQLFDSVRSRDDASDENQHECQEV